MQNKADKTNSTTTMDKNVNMDELFRAVRILRKAKKQNIPLATSSCESLALDSLRLKSKKSDFSLLKTLRWTVYFIIWAFAVLYFFALMNRVTICRWSARTEEI